MAVVKNPPAMQNNAGEAGLIPGLGGPLEEEIATPSSILAWKIPWTEEPGGLQSLDTIRTRLKQLSTYACTYKL